MVTVKITDFPEWEVPNYTWHFGDKHAHKVIVGFDVEYEPSGKDNVKMGGIEMLIQQRKLDDIISIQLAFNYENNHPIKVLIHRDSGDRCFNFYQDLMKPLKKYLTQIGAHNLLKQELKKGNKNHPFTVEMWGFWQGVDISSFSDHERILSEDNSKKLTSTLVTLNGNTVFTSKPLKLTVRDQKSRIRNMFPEMRLVMRDMKKLAPAKASLATLGQMLNLPKLDTEVWDRADGYPTGFYKKNMRTLWKNRPSDFERYAMTDTVITVLYGSFILNFMDSLKKRKLVNFKPYQLKSSLSSIAASVVRIRNKQSSLWINQLLIQQLLDLRNKPHAKASDIKDYLLVLCHFNEKELKHLGYDCRAIFQKLNVVNVSNLTKSNYDLIDQWLNEHIDYELIRKGYYFPDEDDSKNDQHHKYMANDINKKVDLPKAKNLFKSSTDALFGGFNTVMTPGILPEGKYIYDFDLKSAYTVNGNLIPDMAPGLGIWKSYTDVPQGQFENIVRTMESLNGPYTIGVGVFTITYPDKYGGFMISPKRIYDAPRYLRHLETATLTYTDAYNAWMHGASVFTHTLDFPFQARLEPQTMSGISQEGLSQDIFQNLRNQYPDNIVDGQKIKNPMNQLFKTCSNALFGATAQGCKEHTSSDYKNGQSYYLPFSIITAPLLAMAYTAFTRYHITLLREAILTVDATASLDNVVTDGILVRTDTPLDVNRVNHIIEQIADRRYQDVSKKLFNGVFFEQKEGSKQLVANIRTRFTFSVDDQLHSTVGLPSWKLKPHTIFDQYLNQGRVQIDDTKRIITGLNQMKHDLRFKHLQSSWEQPNDINLGYDFAFMLNNYHDNGDFCYWDTVPYQNESEFKHFWNFGRELVKYGPFYKLEYAPYFKRTLDEKRALPSFDPLLLGEFVKKQIPGSPQVKQGNEVYYNWCYYVIKNNLDPALAYQKVTKLINEKHLYCSMTKGNGIPTFESFQRYLRAHRNRPMIINYVLLYHLRLI